MKHLIAQKFFFSHFSVSVIHGLHHFRDFQHLITWKWKEDRYWQTWKTCVLACGKKHERWANSNNNNNNNNDNGGDNNYDSNSDRINSE